MNIHTYEKLWLAASMVLIVGFIATVTYGAVGLGIAMIDDDESTIDPDSLDEDERFSDPRVEEMDDGTYEAYVVAEQYRFNPDPLVVPANSTVTLYVTSPDVIHGFEVVGTNVNTMVIPGEVSKMTIEFEESEEYGLLCNEYCGAGHHGMEGEIHVVPEEEFEEGEQ
jgi:cytochrome c oxidase subunit 2